MANTQDGPGLLPVTRELAEGSNYAAISTLLPSGRIQTQYIWVGTDGERLHVTTETGGASSRTWSGTPVSPWPSATRPTPTGTPRCAAG